jgi:hypothetical protein
MSDNVGFTTTPGLYGAQVRAKNQSDPRWGTTGMCFGMLGTDYVLVMFDEFPGYVAAVPVAEFAQHYFLRPQMSDAWCDDFHNQANAPETRPVPSEEQRHRLNRHRQVAQSLGFRSSVSQDNTPQHHSQR